MRILALTNLFPHPWDPRRGTFNRQQFEQLGQRHQVDVWTAVGIGQRLRRRRQPVTLQHVHARPFLFAYPPRVGRSLHAACWALSLLAQRAVTLWRGHYDCLLASFAYPDGVAVGWLARRLGLPYVLKVHGNDLNVMAAGGAQRRQISRALRGAAGVVAVSRALADKAIALGADPARVEVIYNGVDGERFAPADRVEARHRLHLPANAPLLLFVGNLKPAKGCLDLLEAFPAVLAAYPTARLLYVGSGPADMVMRLRARQLGCAEHVQWLGAIDHAALADWFCAADLLSLPSHAEGVPNVVLEAMACGTPVVASQVGGIPEVVPPLAGLLVPPRRPEALARALCQALAQQWDRQRIAGHAAAFRWDDNIDRLERVLRNARACPNLSLSASA